MLKVLVIDHIDEHVSTLVDALNGHGCEARGARTSAIAFDICETWHPDMVICNAMLDSMRGWYVAHEILNSKMPRPYMVALDASDMELRVRNIALCQEFGFDYCAPKPITFTTLLWFVAKAQEYAAKREEGANHG